MNSLIERQSERKIKIIRTDNGGEYCSKSLAEFCRVNGIQHQVTNVYTPQQNGIAIRMNRTVVERAKCMLFDAELEKCYWAEAVNMAVFIINHSVNSVLVDQTPEEAWTGKKVNVSEFKLFGSKVMVHVPKENRKKWDSKSDKMIFVGYDNDRKGYRCIDPISKKLTTSRDVKFCDSPSLLDNKQVNENKLVEAILPSNVDTPILNTTVNNEDELDEVRDITINQNVNADVIVTDATMIENTESRMDESYNSYDSFESAETNDCLEKDPDFDPLCVITNEQNELRRSSRERRTRQRDGYVSFLSHDNAKVFDPISFKEALSCDDSSKWQAAMHEEMQSLDENETWTMTDLPPGRKLIKTKWVYKSKCDDAGNVIRYKARLVAKGCSQKYGLDYTETFSPVVRYSSIRFLMALAVQKGLKIDQMDAVTAFLQGDVNEEIYVDQPEGFHDGTQRVCKLNRAIYGLKQASRQWNLKLESALKSFGLKKSKMDPCVFYSTDLKLMVAIYVDDILIFWSNEYELAKLKSSLCSMFRMKDMKAATTCIGILITQTDDGIELDQANYVKEILHRFNMSDCNPISTPCDTNQKLSLTMQSEVKDEKIKDIPYQEAVGCLLYLVQGTRPDIAFAVNDVSRFNNY